MRPDSSQSAVFAEMFGTSSGRLPIPDGGPRYRNTAKPRARIQPNAFSLTHIVRNVSRGLRMRQELMFEASEPNHAAVLRIISLVFIAGPAHSCRAICSGTGSTPHRPHFTEDAIAMNVPRTGQTKTTAPHVVSYPPADHTSRLPRTDTSYQGVIILSASGDVLYMSPRAVLLIRQFDTCPTGNPPARTLPAPLRTIGHEVCCELQASLMHGNGLVCDVRHALPSSEGTLFVHGLGVPNQEGGQFLTALIVSNVPIDFRLLREA